MRPPCAKHDSYSLAGPYWHNRRFQWDPENWRFIDDDEANEKFLDNPRRDPWQLPEVPS